MSIEELTKEQKAAIRQAYFTPSSTVSAIVKRIMETVVPMKAATSWLMLCGYIGYDDKLMLDGIA